MNCDKCGELLAADDVFCTNCGAPVNRQGSPVVSNPMQPQPMQTGMIPQQPINPMQNGMASQQPMNQMVQPQLNPYQQALVQQNNILASSEAEDNKMANKLSIISLLLHFGAPIVLAILAAVASTVSSTISGVITSLSSITSIAAYVLMIVVRVKYPKNTFGKIVMWIYIAEVILSILVFVFIVVSCLSCAAQYNA